MKQRFDEKGISWENWELKTQKAGKAGNDFNLWFPKGGKGGIAGTFDFSNVE